MHRALQIPDVIRLIVEDLLEEDDEFGSAVATVLCCKVFFESGISAVWRTRSLGAFVNLASVLLKRENEGNTVNEPKQFTIASRRDRFRLYSALVNHITFMPWDMPGTDLQNLRLLTPPTAPYMFANLLTLEAFVRDPQHMTAVSLLICPSLEIFSIKVYQETVSANPLASSDLFMVAAAFVLEAIAEVSTNLRTLSLRLDPHITNVHTVALAKIFTHLKKLESFETNICDWGTDFVQNPLSPPLDLRRLRTLDLQCSSSRQLPNEVLFRMVLGLESLSVLVSRSELNALQPGEIKAMTAGLSYCTQLFELRMSVFSSPTPILWEEFIPISRCTLLRVCELNYITDSLSYVEDSHINRLTKDMGQLKQLIVTWSPKARFLGSVSRDVTHLTAATLRHLAENCPLIEQMHFEALDLSALVTPPPVLPRTIPIKLYVPQVYADKPFLAAAFLASLWSAITISPAAGESTEGPDALNNYLAAIRSFPLMERMKTMRAPEAEAVLKVLTS